MELNVKHLQISLRELENLNRNVWSHEYVAADLTVDGNVESVLIRYRGGHTRSYPKKSYEIVSSSGTMHLNAEYDDPSQIRNALSFRFFDWIGVPSPRTSPCVLWMNGRKLGVYLEIEAVDRMFFERRRLPCTTLMYAGNDDANFSLFNPDTGRLKTSLFQGYELIIGNSSEQKELEQFIFHLNTLSSRKLFTYLQLHLDIDNYLRWLAGAVCTGNIDGFAQNYAIYHPGQNLGYRMIPWDYEGSWGRNCFGRRTTVNLVPIKGHNNLTKKMLTYSEISNRYRQIMNDIIESFFTESRVMTEVEHLMANIRPYVGEDETKRHSMQAFDKESEVIGSYVHRRRSWLSRKLTSL